MRNQADFERLKQFIFSETGLVYYRDKEAELLRKLDRAVERSKASDYRQYLAMIQDDQYRQSGDFDTLVSELTVGETHFFRDTALFSGFREIVLPRVIQKNAGLKRVWIWSAGCATGEEVYSLSILINRYFPQLDKTWDIRILGTDINRKFLQQAMTGTYTAWSFRGTPEEVKQCCFKQDGDTWQIRPEFKERVAFQYHNLIRMPFPSVFHSLFSFDIILCRNVMIYFEPRAIQKLIRQFRESLVPDGWLAVGHADHNIKYFDAFKTVMGTDTSFYQNSKNRKTIASTPGWTSVENSDPLFGQTRNNQGSNPLKKSGVRVKVPAKSPDKAKKTIGVTDYKPAAARQTAGLNKIGQTNAEYLISRINHGQWEGAWELCNEMIEKNPLDTTLHLLSAFILEHEGRITDAVSSLKKALYLDRKFVIGHYHLGLLYQNLGWFKKALKCFENVVTLLHGMDETQIFEIADSISAAELKSLSEFHLDVLSGQTEDG